MKSAHTVLRGLVALLLVSGGIGFIALEAHGQSDDEKEVAGVVEAVDAQNNVVTVEGVTYTVTGETEYEGINSLSDLSSGEEVEIEYEETTSGREALAVETGDADDEEDEDEGDDEEDEDEEENEQNEVSGVIEAVGDRVLTIDGIEYAVSDQTQYEGISGLSELSSGDEVEIEYEERSNGREAVEVELAGAEDDD